MRLTRYFAIAAASGLLAACGEQAAGPGPATEAQPPATPVEVTASDELPGLSSAPTGIAFWTHPNVSFNSLLLVASADGLASYNMEDGAEVSRVPGMALQGVAGSYAGFGPQAAGLVATFDPSASAFRFYGVDNVSRLFLPLAGGPEMRGPVRGYCLGRGIGVFEPTLFVIQKGELRIFNLAVDTENGAAAISVESDALTPIPDSVTNCAVDIDGIVVLGAETGALYRLDGADSLTAPFAQSAPDSVDEIAILSSEPGDNDYTVGGQIAALDRDTGVIALFDREDGHALGAARITASYDVEAVRNATTFGASAANLGGLYRDGAIALGVDGDAASIRLAPANGVSNALSLSPLPPANPRGTAPLSAEPGSLIIEPSLPKLDSD